MFIALRSINIGPGAKSVGPAGITTSSSATSPGFMNISVFLSERSL